MIIIRIAMERRHVRRGRKQDTWFTFFPHDPSGPPEKAFGLLAAFYEMRLPPGGGSGLFRHGEAEIVTYVYAGALAQQDSTGHSGIMQTGEFQRMLSSHGIRYKEMNASQTDWAHVFRIVLRPSMSRIECTHEQKRFTVAHRRNVPCVVASRDGQSGSLQIHEDARIYSSILDAGHHFFHELLPGRSAWLHVVCGKATLCEAILIQGDGAGIVGEASVSLIVGEKTEILFVDLGPVPDSPESARVP